MTLEELLAVLKEHKDKGYGFLIHQNLGDINEIDTRMHGDVEFSNMFFTDWNILGRSILCFHNSNREPISYKEDGTPISPIDSVSSMFLHLEKVEKIEKFVLDISDFDASDSFELPVTDAINVFMGTESSSATSKRNVITIGFLEF